MSRLHRCFFMRHLRARPLAMFAAFFLAGLLVAARWDVSPALCGVSIAAALCGALALRRRPTLALITVMLAALLFGMWRMNVALSAFPNIDTRYSVEMVGTVDSEPFVNDNGRLVCVYRLETANGQSADMTLRLYLRGDEALFPGIDYGQRLRLKGHIWASDPVLNPYEFDFGAWLHRHGLNAIATAKIEDVEVVDIRRDAQSIVIAARRAIGARIDALFPNNAPIVRALVLGDRSLLSDEMRSALNATGTAHLISISGLHVTVLAMAVAWLLSRFMPLRLANLLALAPLLLYGTLVGFKAPFVRALTMFAVYSFVPYVGQPSDGITRLAVAMLGLLIVKPMDALDTGFILSFTTSAGILLLTSPLQTLLGVKPLLTQRPSAKRWRRVLHRLAVYLPTLLCASLAAQLAALPVVVAAFGVQSAVSIPFNLVCVPLCMAGFILSVVALVISAILMPLGALLAGCADVLFSALVAVTQYSSTLPFTGVRVGRYPLWLVGLHVAIILAASDLSAIAMRVRRFLPFALLGVAGLSALCALAFAWPFSVSFLAAGEADCAILRTRGHTYLIDAGDVYTPAPDVLNATCLHLDAVFLSHPHVDHAGGLAKVLAAFKPEVIYVPSGWFEVAGISPTVAEGVEQAQAMGIPFRELSTGDALRLSDDVTLTVHAPEKDARPDSLNDLSLLLSVEHGGHAILFPGDLTEAGEPDIIPDCDILKVAHHGAENSTSARFLKAATPEIAIISVGENSNRHPRPEVVERLTDCGAAVLRTDTQGMITATLSGDTWNISTFIEAEHEVE